MASLGWIQPPRFRTPPSSLRNRSNSSPPTKDLLPASGPVTAFAGTIGTHKINWLNRKVEIGYWIASKFQGQGIITSACRALIDYAFREWNLNRVEIHCATTNKRSCRVAERLGFQWEGVLREAQLVGTRYLDLNVYGMLAREWKLRSL